MFVHYPVLVVDETHGTPKTDNASDSQANCLSWGVLLLSLCGDIRAVNVGLSRARAVLLPKAFVSFTTVIAGPNSTKVALDSV